jgi:hypothetical protein
MENHHALSPPASFQYESENEILKEVPYFEKGCERRIVFTSDPIPSENQYKLHDGGEAGRPEFQNAVDKFFAWCRSRPTAVNMNILGWDEANYKDGRRARHFVLQMGAPKVPYGDANRLASRLGSIWSHYLIGRLRYSHLTIEIEIPNHRLSATEYFAAYMNQILSLTDSKKLGHRLTVKLSDATEALLNNDPDAFYAAPINVQHGWETIIGNPYERRAFPLAVAHPYNRNAPLIQEDIDYAQGVYWEQKAEERVHHRKVAISLLSEVQKFIQRIRDFKHSKVTVEAAVTQDTDSTETPV